MKRTLTAGAAAALFASTASAQLATAAPVWTLFKGAAIVQPRLAYASSDTCTSAANAQAVAKATKYSCKSSSSSTAIDKLVTTKTTVDTTIAVNVLPPPVMNAGLYVKTGSIPTAGIGGAADDLIFSGRFPDLSDDRTGDFRTVCLFSHMAFDDPIVMPGQPGKSHLHTFAGNMLTNANSTVASISSTGNSTCRGGTINRSSYWQPAVIDTFDGTPIKPDSAVIYYKSGYNNVAAAEVHELPTGLRMVAGDSKGSQPVDWGPTEVLCSTPGGDVRGYRAAFPESCAVGNVIWTKVTFPQCWDGKNLDSPDHRSHMAYGGTGQGVKPGCPDTHPVALPSITISFLYTVTDAAAYKRWRLASDVYDKSQAAGYSLHADWFNGWKPEIVKRWTTQCINAAKDCGADMLGEGWSMGGEKP